MSFLIKYEPTYAAELVDAIMKIIDSGAKSNDKIYHYSNEGVASWYDFAVAIMDHGGVDCKVNPIETKDYPTPAK